ncbi:MAG: hypothetical protein IJS13_03385 [Paludibacteraceae bacterium]|nr:hypothetical protein [Paludibacteraceae bacterium]
MSPICFKHTVIILLTAVCLLSCRPESAQEDMPQQGDRLFFSVRCDSAGATTMLLTASPTDSATAYLCDLLPDNEQDSLDIVMHLVGYYHSGKIQPQHGEKQLLFRHLKPASQYIFALQRIDLQSDKETGHIELYRHKTDVLPLTDMQIRIHVATDTVYISPSSNEPYIVFSETMDDWNTFTHNAGVEEESLRLEIESLALWYENDGVPLPIHNGTHCQQLPHDGNTWIIFAAPYTETVNGNPVALVVKTQKSTSLHVNKTKLYNYILR